MAKKAKQPAAEKRFNPEQLQVIAHTRGPLRVGSVAGSGKTQSLIERTASLIENSYIPPEKILLISFSSNARKELEKRLVARVPGVHAKSICRTWHSIGLDIFHEEVDPEKKWALDTTGRLWRKAIRASAKIAGHNLAAKGSQLNSKMIENLSACAKSRMLIASRTLRRLGMTNEDLKKAADKIAGEHLADEALSILHLAEDLRQGKGVEENGEFVNFITFDDMLFAAADLLRMQDIREKWAQRWSFVMQDEAQDANPVQDAIASALSSIHTNYMIVGDPAQSIFGFRSSTPERMLAFEKDWPTAITITMNRNYRSGIEIIALANKVIAQMPPDTIIATAMKCERNTRAHVSCHSFIDETAEADAIAKNIYAHFDQGVAWRDQAIVIRMNFMARSIEVALAKARIPYRIVSGESFFKMTEASILLGYLRVALDRATIDDMEACMSNPSRMLGKSYFEDLAKAKDANQDMEWRAVVNAPQIGRGQREKVDEWLWLIETIRDEIEAGKSAYQVLHKLVGDIKLGDWLKSDNDGDNAPDKNIEQVLSFAADYDTAAALVDAVDAILDHKKMSSKLRNVVEVSTIHRYKGREANVVYMPYLASGSFPATNGDLLEERRLFYVGVTRAMDELWMSYPMLDSFDATTSPSILLHEIEMEITDSKDFVPGRKIQPSKQGQQMVLI